MCTGVNAGHGDGYPSICLALILLPFLKICMSIIFLIFKRDKLDERTRGIAVGVRCERRKDLGIINEIDLFVTSSTPVDFKDRVNGVVKLEVLISYRLCIKSRFTYKKLEMIVFVSEFLLNSQTL